LKTTNRIPEVYIADESTPCTSQVLIPALTSVSRLELSRRTRKAKKKRKRKKRDHLHIYSPAMVLITGHPAVDIYILKIFDVFEPTHNTNSQLKLE
jgi:hypothetical protein